MADHIFLVFSTPPDDVPWEEFSTWYDLHVRQILALPGWVAAERFAVRFVDSKSGAVPAYRHFVRYEVDGDFGEAWMVLRAAVDGGRMTFPEWWGKVDTIGWEGTAEGERVLATD